MYRSIISLMGSNDAAPGGGGGGVPATIPDLIQWLKADAITGLSDGNAIATWEDSSSANNDATQSSSGNRPIYKTNIVNGLPAVQFAKGTGTVSVPGTAKWFDLGDRSALTAGEVFVVVKRDVDTPGDGASTGLYRFNNTGGSMATNYPFTDGNVYDSFGSTTRKSTGNPSQNLAAWHIYSVYSASADWRSYFNGVSFFNTATNTVGFPNATRLGSGFDGSFSVYLDGYIAEFILYSRKLNSTERSDIITYLKTKYGIS